jgi:hypothetical protein
MEVNSLLLGSEIVREMHLGGFISPFDGQPLPPVPPVHPVHPVPEASIVNDHPHFSHFG